MTIEDLAADYAARFEGRTRDDGSRYRCVKDGEKIEELATLIQDAHGDMLPDDHRYAMIEAALDAIAEDGDEAALEPAIYTHELTGWLHSRVDRYGYCDEAVAEYGKPDGENPTILLLQWGMGKEQDEVLCSVRNSLNEIIEAREEAG